VNEHAYRLARLRAVARARALVEAKGGGEAGGEGEARDAGCLPSLRHSVERSVAHGARSAQSALLSCPSSRLSSDAETLSLLESP
jgi:hypothetical protein